MILSTIVFNMIINRLLRKLPKEMGISIENIKTKAIVYADDLVLIASMRMVAYKS